MSLQTMPSHKRTIGFQALTKVAILLGLGVYFAYNLLTGNINNYVNPQWAWLSGVAAALFLLLALVSVYAYLRDRPQPTHEHLHDYDHDEAHVHQHESHSHAAVTWPVLSILLLPLVLGVGVPSQPLGASALENSAGTTRSMIERAGPADDNDTSRWNIWDWQRTYYANVHPDDWFNGKEANFSGFVFHPGGLGPDEFVLARYVMRHCAADAFGVGMLVKSPGGGSLPQDTWLQLNGAMAVEPFQAENTLLVKSNTLTNLDSPDNPYIYPSFYVVPK
jgi:putative membrane protein